MVVTRTAAVAAVSAGARGENSRCRPTTRSIESTRIYLQLTNDWVAAGYRRAAELIDANNAVVAEMLALEEATGRSVRSRSHTPPTKPPPIGPRSPGEPCLRRSDGS